MELHISSESCFVPALPCKASPCIHAAVCDSRKRQGDRVLWPGQRLVMRVTRTVCQLSDGTTLTRREAVSALAAGLTSMMFAAVTSPEAARAALRLADPDAGQNVITTESGLRYYDFTKGGDGTTVTPGCRVRFHLVLGTTGARNGWKIDSTYDRDPLVVTVGAGQVVSGLDEGLRGMRAGGRRRCVVPAALGYKSPADRPVPPGFAEYQRFKNLYLNNDRPYKPDVVFDIEILKVQEPS